MLTILTTYAIKLKNKKQTKNNWLLLTLQGIVNNSNKIWCILIFVFVFVLPTLSIAMAMGRMLGGDQRRRKYSGHSGLGQTTYYE